MKPIDIVDKVHNNTMPCLLQSNKAEFKQGNHAEFTEFLKDIQDSDLEASKGGLADDSE